VAALYAVRSNGKLGFERIKMNGNIYAHFIGEINNKQLFKRLITHVPRPNDEIRMGGEGNEKYYKVTRVIWVYDEPDNPYERVNIGVELCA
jgi:hypothetical protein